MSGLKLIKAYCFVYECVEHEQIEQEWHIMNNYLQYSRSQKTFTTLFSVMDCLHEQ
jgi:hypothetical protein